MLASWVSQASFKPLGVSIAVAKDRAIESLMQVGDLFVLNVLEEGNYQRLMKHFLKRFAPGADRFEGVKTQTAENGTPILTDALAYMECEVASRMDGGDHWLVYSTIDEGRVSKPDSMTASASSKNWQPLLILDAPLFAKSIAPKSPMTSSKLSDVQVLPIGTDTTILRSRSWTRLRFEIEYALAKGTTANSYLIQGDKIALLDPPGETFTEIFWLRCSRGLMSKQLITSFLDTSTPTV